jgi:hypothetical protein
MDYTRVDIQLEQFSYLDVLLHRCPIFPVAPEHHRGHNFGELGHLGHQDVLRHLALPVVPHQGKITQLLVTLLTKPQIISTTLLVLQIIHNGQVINMIDPRLLEGLSPPPPSLGASPCR